MSSSNPLTMMAVLAHPDDEIFGMGSVLAAYAAQGVAVYLLTATRGSCSWFGLPEPQSSQPEFYTQKEQEYQNSARQMGINSLTLLDYPGGELDLADQPEISAVISTHLRRVRPQVVVTFSPDGHSGHPDHIAISQLTHAAVLRAADPQDPPGSSLPPHRVSKLYYQVDSRKLARLVETVFGSLSLSVNGSTRSPPGWEEWMLSCRVSVGDHWRTAWNAILCRQAWLSGFSTLAGLDEKILAALLSDGAFYRVFSLVNCGRQPENDLFAGLRDWYTNV
jgi:LmbE family N-acetylglucosaminyl deacetylase